MKYDKSKHKVIEENEYIEGIEDGFLYHGNIICYKNKQIPEDALYFSKYSNIIPKTLFAIPCKLINQD